MTCVTALVIVFLLILWFPRNVPISDNLLKIDSISKKKKKEKKTIGKLNLVSGSYKIVMTDPINFVFLQPTSMSGILCSIISFMSFT